MTPAVAILLGLTLAGCGSREAPTRARDASTAELAVDARTRRPPIGNLESFTAGMVRIPGGYYLTACLDPEENCRPRRWHIKEFYIDRTEVTVDAYRRCVAARACTAPGASEECPPDAMNWSYPERLDHPINCVNAEQAGQFCRFRGMHLPTMDQYEKAARGLDGRRFPWGDDPPSCDRAVIPESRGQAGCGKQSTWPVGSRPEGASPFGVLDLIGNVAEFVNDGWDPLDPATIIWASKHGQRAMGLNREGRYEVYEAIGGGFLMPPGRLELGPWRAENGDVSPAHGFRCAYQPSFEP